MEKSQFNENYRFLNEFFQISYAKQNRLIYEPRFHNFFKEFFQPFNIKMEVLEDDGLELEVNGGKRIASGIFETEKEMIDFLKKELNTRKKIGALRRIFNV